MELRARGNSRATLESGDRQDRDEAWQSFTDRTADASHRADGAGWSALTHVPVLGDDARGVQTLSGALEVIATGTTGLLRVAVDDIGSLTRDSRIDLDTDSWAALPCARYYRIAATDRDRPAITHIGERSYRLDVRWHT